jgi:hypothetical protein
LKCLNIYSYLKEYVVVPNAHGSVTSIERRSRAFQILCDFRNDFFKTFADYEDDEEVHHTSHEKWGIDIPDAVDTILMEKMFENLGARLIDGKKDFKYSSFHLSNVLAFRKKLSEYATEADAADEYRKEARLNVE